MEEKLLALKSEIVGGFWKNKFITIGKTMFPKKKYKHLKVLSLTNSRNTAEVDILTKEHISSKSDLYAWCNDSIEALSLESEAKYSEVIEDAKFEETLLNCSTHKLDNCFPFHILNIDFTSQSLEQINGRIEKELQSIEKILVKQKDTSGDNYWLVLFTTLIDSIGVNVDDIKTNSDGFPVDGWGGITFSKTGNLNVLNDIKNIILEFFQKMKDKYGLNVNIDSFTKQVNSHEVMSISIMMK